MSRSVCILYGLNEGPYMGRALRVTLLQAGFTITTDPLAADIIFAHSGGCLLVPPNNKARLIMQVGIPYWPGRLWLAGLARKVRREAALYRQERRLGQWGRKWLHHFLYAFNVPASVRMAQNLSYTKPWNSRQPQIVIRNQFDEFCSPDIVQAPFNGPRTFISLPGGHDDCWDHPEPYVSLLQSLV